MSQHMLTISSKGWQSCCLILCRYYKQWQLLTFWYFRNCNTKILMIHRVWNLDNLYSVPAKKLKSMPGKQLYRFSIPAWFSCLVENITKLTAVSGLLCSNATAVSIIMKVYHSSLDVSKWLVPLDFGYEIPPRFVRLWRRLETLKRKTLWQHWSQYLNML